MAQKKVRFITPTMIAVWPKLDVPDTYQPKDKKGNPKGDPKVRYLTDAAFMNAEDEQKVRSYLKKVAVALLPDRADEADAIKLPLKEETKKDDSGKKVKTGRTLLTATSGVKYKPPMFDAKNNALPAGLALGGGTKFKLDLSINEYDMSDTNFGLNFYINAVQVIDLVEKGVGKSNFEATDGFEFDGEAEAPKAGFGATENTDDDPLAF